MENLNEPILEDNYPIYGNYLYVVDGRVYVSDYHDISVRELKAREKFKEVRRCDMAGRGLFKKQEERSPEQQMSAILAALKDYVFTKEKSELNWVEFYKLCGPVKMSNEDRKVLAEIAVKQNVHIGYGKKVTITRIEG